MLVSNQLQDSSKGEEVPTKPDEELPEHSTWESKPKAGNGKSSDEITTSPEWSGEVEQDEGNDKADETEDGESRSWQKNGTEDDREAESQASNEVDPSQRSTD